RAWGRSTRPPRWTCTRRSTGATRSRRAVATTASPGHGPAASPAGWSPTTSSTTTPTSAASTWRRSAGRWSITSARRPARKAPNARWRSRTRGPRTSCARWRSGCLRNDLAGRSRGTGTTLRWATRSTCSPKGPIGLTDEVAFIAGGGTPIPRVKAHAAALQDYAAHPAWSFRDPVTGAQEPIYAVHYNKAAANAMGVAFQYDVGFQRQCWQIHLLTNWCGDNGWVKHVTAEYRGFVYLSDVIDLGGTVVGKSVDESGEHVV